MRFMCWEMDVKHRNDHFLADADYWSHLGANLCFDPLLREYIKQVQALRTTNPSPTSLLPTPENMPYFRGPRLPAIPPTPATVTLGDASSTYSEYTANASVLINKPIIGLQHLSNHPVRFGHSSTPHAGVATLARLLYNSDLTQAASILAKFDCAVYGFNSGYFPSTIRALGLPFTIVLACDPFANGRALFQEIGVCPTILSSPPALLDHIRGSGITAPMSGYLIHSNCYTSTEPTSRFWEVQVNIVIQICLLRSLSIVVALVLPDHHGRAVYLNFVQHLRMDGWIFSDTHITFTEYGDSVAGSCRLLIAIHSNTEEGCHPINIKTPPSLVPYPIAQFMWALFNKPELAISYSKDDPLFNNHAVNNNGLAPLRATIPSNAQHVSAVPGFNILYHFHRHDDNPSNLVRSAVISADGICPAFQPIVKPNIFGHYFGVEFRHNNHSYARAVSPFESVLCFRLSDQITYKLSHPSNAFCLDAAVPALTSARVFEYILERCLHI
jgi:hypothetical protein